MRRICLTILVCILLQSATAQPYYFRHYQVENGLSNNTVFSITQDNYGFIWFATKDGISRFDGIHFRIFRPGRSHDPQQTFPNYIYALASDPQVGTWAGAEQGLFRYNPVEERLDPLLDSLRSVHSLDFDNQHRLWFISGFTVFRYDSQKDQLTRFDPRQFFNATSLCIAKDGKIWFSTADGYLATLDVNEQGFRLYNVFAHSPAPSSTLITRIRRGDGASIFVATASQGIKRFSIDSLDYSDILTYNADHTTIFGRDILEKNSREFWFATESGIYVYNTETHEAQNLKKKFLDPNSLNDNAIYSLFKDREGSVWVGTFFGGVNYYAEQNAVIRKYFPDNTASAISGNAVREICEDQLGHLWVGTEDGGLNRIDKATGEHQQFQPNGKKTGISYLNIHGLLAVGNNLWVGTFEHGIDILDIRTGLVKKHYMAGPGLNQLKSNFALCFVQLKSGAIMVGTSNGLYTYRPATDDFIQPPLLPRNLMITSFREASDGSIWVATNNRGLYWYNEKSGTHGRYIQDPKDSSSIPANAINDVYQDQEGRIWVATEGGGLANLLPDGSGFKRYGTDEGLPSNIIFKVLEDNQQQLWVTTSKGLVSLQPDKGLIETYTQANGLLNDQFNYHSGYRDAEGRLYFGSVKGMISFLPGDLNRVASNAPLYITAMQVHNKDITVQSDSTLLSKSIILTDKVTLPYYKSSISFDFAALSFIAPEMTEYQYQLEGLDDNWTNIGSNRKVYFTNLSPGTYRFLLRAGNETIANRPERALTIEILPPFWASDWAYPIYGLVIALLIWLLFSTYHRRQLIKKEKEIYESKIEFFTNVAHELRTPLTLIKGPVENLLERKHEMIESKEDLDCLDRNTNRLMELVSQVLDFRQTEIRRFTLSFSRVNIGDVLEELFLSFNVLAKKKQLQYELLLPPRDLIVPADAEALRKIFSNLINNAVKYADKVVRIQLEPLAKNADQLLIRFENDGHIIPEEAREKIFEPFYRLQETSHRKGTGIGLTLSRSLATLHGGSLELVSGKPGMNCFELTLPLQRTNENLDSSPDKKDELTTQPV